MPRIITPLLCPPRSPLSAKKNVYSSQSARLALCRKLPEGLGTFLEYKGRPATGRVTATLAGGIRVIAFQANVVGDWCKTVARPGQPMAGV